MNDRFKFRVWNKQDERYAYSNNSDDILYIETDGELAYGVYNNDYEDMDYIPESEVIVEQCTGLKDKNGKLIYEGDIVTDGTDIFEVIWDYNAWCIQTNKFQHFLTEGFEVIGNIHENKELLND